MNCEKNHWIGLVREIGIHGFIMVSIMKYEGFWLKCSLQFLVIMKYHEISGFPLVSGWSGLNQCVQPVDGPGAVEAKNLVGSGILSLPAGIAVAW